LSVSCNKSIAYVSETLNCSVSTTLSNQPYNSTLTILDNFGNQTTINFGSNGNRTILYYFSFGTNGTFGVNATLVNSKISLFEQAIITVLPQTCKKPIN
jgi:hypothetical protein